MSAPVLAYCPVPLRHLGRIVHEGWPLAGFERAKAQPGIRTFVSRASLHEVLLDEAGEMSAEVGAEMGCEPMAILTVRIAPGARHAPGAGFVWTLFDPIAPEAILAITDDEDGSLAIEGFSPTLLGYRAGALDSPRGVFFADSFDAAWIYAQHNGSEVCAYALQPQRILDLESPYVWEAKRLGLSVPEVLEHKASRRDPYFLRNLDARILAQARRDGFDAIRYSQPTAPLANFEIVLVDAKSATRLGFCDDQGVVWPMDHDLGLESPPIIHRLPE